MRSRSSPARSASARGPGRRSGSGRGHGGLLVQMGVEHGGEGGEVHRLGEEVVHARGEAAFALPLDRRRGHRDHRQSGSRAGPGPDLPGRRVAVHAGHLHVHQDGVERLALEVVERREPVVGGRRLVAQGREHPDRDQLVDRVVLHHQDPAAVPVGAEAGAAAARRLRRRRRAGRGAGAGGPRAALRRAPAWSGSRRCRPREPGPGRGRAEVSISSGSSPRPGSRRISSARSSPSRRGIARSSRTPSNGSPSPTAARRTAIAPAASADPAGRTCHRADDRGAHQLKGVPEEWRLFALQVG